MISKGNCWTSDIKLRLHRCFHICLGVKTVKVSSGDESNTINVANKVKKPESDFPIIINIGKLGVQIDLPLLNSVQTTKGCTQKSENTCKSLQTKEKNNRRKLGTDKIKQGVQEEKTSQCKIVGFRQGVSKKISLQTKEMNNRRKLGTDKIKQGVQKEEKTSQGKIVGFRQEVSSLDSSAPRVIVTTWGDYYDSGVKKKISIRTDES